MRLLSIPAAALVLISCAGASHTPATATHLTSIDTAYYEVPGRTRQEWSANLPRAAQAAGIASGAPAFTIAHMMWSFGRTRTTSIGCQVDGSLMQLRLGHVMPRLTSAAAPSEADRASWDAFVASLWEGAHAREAIGARLADSMRVELRNARGADCAELIARTRQKVEAFGARYSEQVAAEQRGVPATVR